MNSTLSQVFGGREDDLEAASFLTLPVHFFPPKFLHELIIRVSVTFEFFTALNSLKKTLIDSMYKAELETKIIELF